MKKYEIVKHETQGYFYIWDLENNIQLCDSDGEPIRFATIEQAQQFIETIGA